MSIDVFGNRKSIGIMALNLKLRFAGHTLPAGFITNVKFKIREGGETAGKADWVRIAYTMHLLGSRKLGNWSVAPESLTLANHGKAGQEEMFSYS